MGCYVDRNENGSVSKVGLENTSISEEVSLAIQRNGGNPMNLTSEGKPSKLYEDILALPEVDGDRSKADVIKAKVYSDNFLNWFGDWLNPSEVKVSKVVDKNGEPLMVYHGTDAKFSEFTPQSRSNRRSIGLMGDGFYFTPEVKTAREFGKVLIPTFISAKDVLDFNNISNRRVEQIINDSRERRGRPRTFKVDKGQDFSKMTPLEAVQEFKEYSSFKSGGVDGYLLLEGEGLVDPDGVVPSEVQLKVNNSNQIKSVFNEGEFSSDTGDIRFQKGGEVLPSEVASELVSRLEVTGLAKKVYKLSSEKINAKLNTLQGEGVQEIPNGFIHNGEVYLNMDTMTLDTPIHEFSHLYLDALKTTRPGEYNQGMSLIEAELGKENSEIKEVIDFVRETQPELEGKTLSEEIMAELVGRRGVELLGERGKSPISEWLKRAWEVIKGMLGLSEIATVKVAEMSLLDFADAVAIDLVRGERLEGLVFPFDSRNLSYLHFEIFPNPEAREALVERVHQYLVRTLKVETKKNKWGEEEVTSWESGFTSEEDVYDDEILELVSKKTAERFVERLEGDLDPTYGFYLENSDINSLYLQDKDKREEFRVRYNEATEEEQDRMYSPVKAKAFTIFPLEMRDIFMLGLEVTIQSFASNVKSGKEFGDSSEIPLITPTKEAVLELSIKEVVVEESKEDLDKRLEVGDKVIARLQKEHTENIAPLVNKIKDKYNSLEGLQRYKEDTISDAHFEMSRIYDKFQWASRKGRVTNRNPPEPLASFKGGRGTGHYGTGYYFTGFPQREITSMVDTSKYLLARVRNRAEGVELHELLKNLTQGVSKDVVGLQLSNRYWGKIETIKQLAKWIHKNERREQYLMGDKIPKRTLEEIEETLTNTFNNNFLGRTPYETPRAETLGTTLMKSLGYNGIDVRGVLGVLGQDGLDNFEYGTVIYDLNNTIEGQPIIHERGWYTYQEKEAFGLNPKSIKFQKSVKSNTTSRSILFDNLASNPHLDSKQALDLYKHRHGDKLLKFYPENGGKSLVADKYGEPILFYRTPSTITQNFEEALQSSGGSPISVGFITSNNITEANSLGMFEVSNEDVTHFEGKFRVRGSKSFYSVATVPSSTDTNTVAGTLNKGILEGKISPKKRLVSGEWKLQGAGGTDIASNINANAFKVGTTYTLGANAMRVAKDGTFILEKTKNTFDTSAGKKTTTEILEIVKKGGLKALAKIVGDAAMSLYYSAYKTHNKIFRPAPRNNMSEKDLKLALLNVLKSLDISVMGLSEYIDRYNAKNGKDPDVNALADIANQVVAFAQGQDTLDNVSEETAHIFIEGYRDQAAIDLAAEEVHETDEWVQHSEFYREKYSENYKGEELERVVRREILGKILAERVQRVALRQSVQPPAGIRGLLVKFLDWITGNTENAAKVSDRLDSLMNTLAIQMLEGDVSPYVSKELLQDSKYTYFNASKSAVNALDKAINKLESRRITLRAEGGFDTFDLKGSVAQLEGIRNQLEGLDAISGEQRVLELWRAATILTSAVSNQVTGLQKSIGDKHKKAERGGTIEYLSPAELTALEMLRELPQAMSELGDVLRKLQQFGDRLDRYTQEVNKIDQQVRAIAIEEERLRELDNKQTFERIFTSQVISDSELESAEEKFEDIRNKEIADISIIKRWFGSLQHAGNVVLNMIDRIISENTAKANLRFLNRMDSFKKIVDEGGWGVTEFRKLIAKDSSGKYTGFLKSDRDYQAFENAKMQREFELYNEIILEGNPPLTFAEYKEGLGVKRKFVNKGQSRQVLKRSEFTAEQRGKYDEAMWEWKMRNEEMRYTPEYYARREQMFSGQDYTSSSGEVITGIGREIGEDAINFLNNISRARGEILNKYREESGKIDFAKITPHDHTLLQMLSHRRKNAASLIDPVTGEPKTPGSVEERLARDLTAYMEHMRANWNQRDVSNTFYTQLEGIPSSESYGWLMANGAFSIKESFYSTRENSTANKVEEEIASLEGGVLDQTAIRRLESLRRFRDLYNRRQQILKQYKLENSSLEITYDLIPSVVKDNLKEIEENLSFARRALNYESTDSEVDFESTKNEAYYQELQNQEITEGTYGEFRFLLKHMTNTNRSRSQRIRQGLLRLEQGVGLDRELAYFLQNQFGIEDINVTQATEILNREGIDKLSTDFARRHTLGYFNRFAPRGYRELMEGLKPDGGIDVRQLVLNLREGVESTGLSEAQANALRFVEFRPNFTWQEETSDNTELNPNYVENFEGGMSQPKLEKYGYAPNSENHINNLSQKEREMLDMLRGLKREGLADMSETGRANTYELPQISAGVFQKLENIGTDPKEGLLNYFKDLKANRVDEKYRGEQFEGENINDLTGARIIPKFYLDKLEDPSDLSHELLYSYGMFTAHAIEYKQKQSSVSEVLALEQRVMEAKYRGKSKSHGNESNTYQMVKEAVDNHFFGIRHNWEYVAQVPVLGEVDLGKVALFAEGLVRKANLGFSHVVAFTGMTSGILNTEIEARVGEHFNNHSANWAARKITGLMPDLVNNTGARYKDSELYRVGELFGVYTPKEGIVSSGYNRVLRTIKEPLPLFAMMEVANKPVVPRVLYSVLDDSRYVAESRKFLTFNQFKRHSKLRDATLTDEAIMLKWTDLRGESLYNYMENLKGTGQGAISFREVEGLSPVESKKVLENAFLNARSKVVATVENIDGVVSPEAKSAATRNALLVFTTAHRGWLQIFLERRFKKEHFNLKTGQTEQGHYRTLAKTIRGIYKNINPKNEGSMSFLEAVNQEWDNMLPHEKKNTRRMAVDLAALALMTILTRLVLGLADDEEEEDNHLLQYLAYITVRTNSELASSQLVGIPGLADVIEKPVVAANTVQEILKVKPTEWFDEVESGRYEGMSKLERTMLKITWGKHFHSLGDIRASNNMYRMLNSRTLLYIPTAKENREDSE